MNLIKSKLLIRIIVATFFFIAALYSSIIYKAISPLIAFAIFLIYVYIIGFIFKKGKTSGVTEKVPLLSISIKMILLITLAIVLILIRAFLNPEGIDNRTVEISIGGAALIITISISFYFLTKPLGFNKPEYFYFMNVKGSIIRFVIWLFLTIIIFILIYEFLKWLT